MVADFVISDMNDGYIELLDKIIKRGTKRSPRGMVTYEVEDARVVLENPVEAMPVCDGRKLSKKILAAETIQWLSGVSDLAQLDGASKGRFSAFSDNGRTLYGAYGPRASHGLERAVDLLARDQDSRQAVVSLWNNQEAYKTLDLPCTVSWGFRIRDDRLNMSTTMRSWDAWTGLTYDLPAMTRIQSAMAWALGVDIGTYVHTAHSFHVYEANVEAIVDLAPSPAPAPQPPTFHDTLGDADLEIDYPTASKRWAWVVERAFRAYQGEEDLPAPFAWYSDLLRDLPRHTFHAKDGYVLPSEPLF